VGSATEGLVAAARAREAAATAATAEGLVAAARAREVATTAPTAAAVGSATEGLVAAARAREAAATPKRLALCLRGLPRRPRAALKRDKLGGIQKNRGVGGAG